MPAKSKKDEPCFTRTSKAGKKYTTCVGEQKRNVKLQREISKLQGTTRKNVTKAEFTEARKGLQKAVAKPKEEKKLKIPSQFSNQSDSVRKLNKILTGFYKDKITKRAEGRILALIRKSKSYDDKKPYVINVSGVSSSGNMDYVVLNEKENKYEDKTLFLGPKAKPNKNE